MKRRIRIWREPPKRNYQNTIEGMLEKTMQPVEPDPVFVKKLKENLIKQKEYTAQEDTKSTKRFIIMVVGILSSIIVLAYTLVRAILQLFKPKKKNQNLIEQ
jgi:anaerobic C4-dicarboxylate transporter